MMAEQNEKLPVRGKNMNVNSRRIKQSQMKKIKFISNEKLTIIKTKKPQMKTLKRIHANVKEVYQTNDPNKKTAFCF